MRYLTIVDEPNWRVASEDTGDWRAEDPRGGIRQPLTFSANRDEAHYDSPDTLDIRRGVRDHLAFGYGINQCLGQGSRGWSSRFSSVHWRVASRHCGLRCRWRKCPSRTTSTSTASTPFPSPGDLVAARSPIHLLRSAAVVFPVRSRRSTRKVLGCS